MLNRLKIELNKVHISIKLLIVSLGVALIGFYPEQVLDIYKPVVIALSFIYISNKTITLYKTEKSKYSKQI